VSKLKYRYLDPAAITSIESDVEAATLASKLIAGRTPVINFTTGNGVTSNTVTTQITAAATSTTARTSLTAGIGVFTGSLTLGKDDTKRVLIRRTGTNNAIFDGTNGAIYGTLTESSGVFTLNYKKADGTSYTTTSALAIDFFFVEIFNLFTMPNGLLVSNGLGIVIDQPTLS
jgi:hypothetical protein